MSDLIKNAPLWAKVLATLAIVLNCSIFRLYDFYEASRVGATIETILRDEYKTASSFQLSRSLSDLEYLHFIRCARLVENAGSSRIFYDTSMKPRCTKFGFIGRFLAHNLELVAANGVQYNLQFNVPFDWQGLILEIFGYVLILGVSISIVRDWKHREARQALIVTNSLSLFDQATQIAHDIRSPLAALEMVMKDMSIPEKEQRLLVSDAASRIRDIASGLLRKGQDFQLPPETRLPTLQLVATLIEQIFAEKRLQYGGAEQDIAFELRISPEIRGLFSKIVPSEFSRVISNLVNNAVEALGGHGKIVISAKRLENSLAISVEDNGKGISPEILGKLGKDRASYGKENHLESGLGLGLLHARINIESWSGKLKIESGLNRGSVFTILLPVACPPIWLAWNLLFDSSDILAVVDDDLSIHEIWRQRFFLVGLPNSIFFSTVDSFESWYSEEKRNENLKFLFDYEVFGSNKSGLDLIESNGLAGKSILVTNRFDEELICERAKHLGVRVLPKMLVAFVPIDLNGSYIQDFVEVVLLDDDQNVRQMWAIAARQRNVKLLCFSNSRDLLNGLPSLSSGTKFFIDANLGEGEPEGIDFAKDLYGRGYCNIHLATGLSPEEFPSVFWIKSVTGKVPPWI